ncbi:MAG: MiaB/RimO family radical SAM methylthiotransferase [Candidatus Aminicenantes bacterium]|nr:MiaB/RimO family radical SAM methylthiotransferase [Candidatus Aminicenantes bacterium]NIM79137.1 MiaB/RimO family radical SAM methylthiotransferase [Candidatus Aminicenantes bacterium]NIN18422.1 MiaB/RimO family radical SAM methylthiotransferase [Candidatus Aminicenantes bacterium]NIN42310.1 MiaB/RimO family radical SAM methylthiotransferase [Candidatus Aminicenantes bacterium]NIN85076.1 MiaB/RimO family radical SAM methylthiotransferase [Candidatus Aminicenantes bacterium]
MKFYVDYFGCRSNQAEIQEWIIDLEDAGYQLTSDLSAADFGILNTCSVTERAEKDIFKFINRVYKKSNIKWIITGCTVSKEKKHLQDKYRNYYFYDNREKESLVERVKALFPVQDNIIYHSAYRSRIFLKIHDGCNFRCSYCIVPFLRGKSVSLPAAEVIKKARYYASLGYREIVLTGINLSSYGYDLFPGENLLNLVQEIAKIRGIHFIRLSSLDPRYIKYDFIKELSYIKKMADSFHFSFQSGSDSVLRRMKRGSKTIEFYKILEHFQHFFPDANFGADILVGFPGETDKEFRQTLNFVTESHLTYTHIFPFSPREGTKAALMEQLPPHIIHKRVNELREVNKIKRMNYRERFIGNTLEGILIEEDPNYSMIVTKNYLFVRVPPVKGYKKKKVKVKLSHILNDNLCEGTIVRR